MKTPDELCKGGTEHGLQSALFQWVRCAMWLGFHAAWDEHTYSLNAPFKDNMSVNYRAVPELKWYHAIHNQGHGDAIRGAQAKAEGTVAGVADTFLPIPRFSSSSNYYGLYIENKLEKFRTRAGGGASDQQHDFIRDMRAAGYACKIAYGWRDAARTLQTYIETGRIET